MRLPNILTLGRFVLAIAGGIALLTPLPFHMTVAAVLFVIAAVTDYFDGYLARRWKQLSQLGAFMDPLADKFLVLLYFAHFTMLGFYPEWLFLGILARDLVHDGFRNFAASKHVIIGANTWSKIKTALQMIALCLCLLTAAQFEIMGTLAGAQTMFIVSLWAMILAFFCGIVGSIVFFRQYASLLTSGE